MAGGSGPMPLAVLRGTLPVRFGAEVRMNKNRKLAIEQLAHRFDAHRRSAFDPVARRVDTDSPWLSTTTLPSSASAPTIGDLPVADRLTLTSGKRSGVLGLLLFSCACLNIVCLPVDGQTMPSDAACCYRSCAVSRVGAMRARCQTQTYKINS